MPSSARFLTWGTMCELKVLNSKEFGVPQSRKRVSIFTHDKNVYKMCIG